MEKHCTKCGSKKHERKDCPLKNVKIRSRRPATTLPRNPLRFVLFN